MGYFYMQWGTFMIEPIQIICLDNRNVKPAQYMHKAVFSQPQENEDMFVSSPKNDIDALIGQDSSLMAKKYELACHVAAYYKTQYENLAKQGCCLA